MERLLSIREAAAYLGLNVATVKYMVRYKRIPFFRLGKRTVRFDPKELERWAKAKKEGSWGDTVTILIPTAEVPRVAEALRGSGTQAELEIEALIDRVR